MYYIFQYKYTKILAKMFLKNFVINVRVYNLYVDII